MSLCESCSKVDSIFRYRQSDFDGVIIVDEVRALGRLLSIPAPLVQRHPFPGPGLAIRILGPVNAAQVKILQQADSIYIEEIRNAGLYDEIAQAFAVLLPVRAVGVMGDARTYEQVISMSFQIIHNAYLKLRSLLFELSKAKTL